MYKRKGARLQRALVSYFLDFNTAAGYTEYLPPFMVNADSAFWTDVTFGARRPFARIEDYRNYLEQLAALPGYFAQETDNMRAGLARGFTPPRVTLGGRDVALASIAEAKTPQKSTAPTSSVDHVSCVDTNGNASADIRLTPHSCTATSAIAGTFGAYRSVSAMWKAKVTAQPSVSRSPTKVSCPPDLSSPPVST